ncbi:hypothetical protein Tco_0099870 [Tanacetum coccineum]
MAKLAFCDYHNMVAILEKTEHNVDFHQIVDFLKASHIRTVSKSSIRRHLKLNDEEGTSTLPENELFENLSLMGYNILPNQRTVQLIESMIVPQGEGSENPTEPHHTPSVQNESPPQEDPTIPQEPLPQETTIPSQSHFDIPTPRRLTKRTIRISQSKVPSPGADETVSPTRDDRHGDAFLTATSLDAGQDMENIAKTSTMPHESSPRVTSLGGDEGSMQQKLQELMNICTSLQRQHSFMAEKIQSQDLEITQLKTRVKTLEDNEKKREGFAQDDAPNMGGWIKGRI